MHCPRPAVTALGVLTLVAVLSTSALAVPPYNNLNGRGGGGGGRYTPGRPTVSPYLTLSQGFNGFNPAINYHTFIRPMRQQRAFNQQQSAQLFQLQQQLNQQSLQQGIRPTGTAAWFMTHQQYFGGNPAPATGALGGAGQ